MHCIHVSKLYHPYVECAVLIKLKVKVYFPPKHLFQLHIAPKELSVKLVKVCKLDALVPNFFNHDDNMIRHL